MKQIDLPNPSKYHIVGNKIYVICNKCGKLVQYNKFVFGSLHVCTYESEQQRYK